MKDITLHAKALLADRPLFMLCLGIIVLALGMMVFFGFQVEPRELQIATHFSSFGETGLYRNKWYYVLSFIFFIIIVAASHIALIAKLLQRDMRAYAVGFGWMTILILFIALLTVISLFSIAYPGV